jgi:hypothetical protein
MATRRFPPPWSVELTQFDLDQTTSFCNPLSFMHRRSREEIPHANDDENHFGDLLYWCGRG